MSVSAFVIVRLDAVSQDERDRCARDTTEWLVRERILAPLHESLWGDHDHAFGEWGPGTNWRSAVVDPLPDAWSSSPGEEVEISAERQVYTAMANSQDFACAMCSTPLSADLGQLVEQWLERTEPDAQCASCGWHAPLGDWPSEYPPAVVGGPAISLYRWPTFNDEFVAEVAAKLGGGRYRSFWTHF